MLSNTAVPKYYGEFREKVLAGEIPVNQEIEMEMNRIDSWIDNPGIFYDESKVEGFITFVESEMTLTDGSPVVMLDSFKVWAEQIFGWYYFVEEDVFEPYPTGGGFYRRKLVKKRLISKMYLIVGRGAAKSLFDSWVHAYFLIIDPSTTHQITTSPTMKQSDEVMAPIRTAITVSKGPVFQFMTEGSLQNTTGNRALRQKLCSTKKGIQNFLTNSIIEVLPMTIDKLQGYRPKLSTVDEWLSGDTREDVIGALEQGASKLDDYLIIATSSEGTVRNGPGDTIKMELMNILKGKYDNPHVSIWWYKLDDVSEVSDPSMWPKANPNIGKTVKYEAYQRDVIRAEQEPATRNDILAKRFGIPMAGFTYFFTYAETIRSETRLSFHGMPCSLGADLSQGDDFCAFTFVFPLADQCFGIKARCYISDLTYKQLPKAMREKYNEFIEEGTLFVMDGAILDMMLVYDDLEEFMDSNDYEVLTFGYDPYNAKEFVERWVTENGEYGVEKVIQGSKTESVPLGELKKLAQEGMLLFDETIMQFAMGNCVVEEDTNGNRKLLKERRSRKIDPVSGMMDGFIAYKLNPNAFD